MNILGVLKTTTPLRVASGFTRELELDGHLTRQVDILCRDAAGNPYIPASTLRGLLRASLDPGSGEFLRLFGSERLARNPARGLDQPEYGVAGRLRAYDARWQQGEQERIERRNALDPITRSADDHKLFTEVLLPTDPAGGHAATD